MLKGKRISLRAVEPEDLDLMCMIENDTRLWAVGNANVPYSRYALRRYIEDSLSDFFADRKVRLVVSTNEKIDLGFIDLQNYDAMHKRAEVGIVLLPEWHGKGYGCEAMELMLEYASSCLHLHQVYAIVSSENQVAIRMFSKIKFKPSGTLSEWLYKGGSDYADAVIFTRILD